MDQPKVFNSTTMLAHIKAKVGDSASSYGGLGPNEARFLLLEIEKLSWLRSEFRELTLNICADSELALEGEDGKYYGLCVSSTYIDQLCSLTGIGRYQDALAVIDKGNGATHD